MISKNLIQRFITSVFLIFLLGLSFNYSFILIFSLILVSLISWIEFNRLISKIFKKKKNKYFFYKLIINILSLFYMIIFSSIVFFSILNDNYKSIILFLFSICICSDIGGLLFGKFFKGKKLTKISPNKTISGSIGSFVLSIILIPIFISFLNFKFLHVYDLIFIVIIVSFLSQVGDLFFSFLKRKANIKDTGNILPGHGGLLDRIDGMLLALPFGTIIWELFFSLKI